jgi:putative transposase
VLAVIDDFTRECRALMIDTSLSGASIARHVGRIAELRGEPVMIVSGDYSA